MVTLQTPEPSSAPAKQTEGTLCQRDSLLRAVFYCNKKKTGSALMISLAQDQSRSGGGGWMMVRDTVRCVATDQPQKPQGTSHLSWIIKNASSGKDRVAPKQENKNTAALIMEGPSHMHTQIHTFPSPESGEVVPVRDERRVMMMCFSIHSLPIQNDSILYENLFEF